MTIKVETSVFWNGKWRCATAQGKREWGKPSELFSVTLYFSREEIIGKLTVEQKAEITKQLSLPQKER